MSDAPAISIVVPTRNRHAYLAVLVRSLLALQSRDFELLVHDNSSEPGGYATACGSTKDPRLRYVFEPTPMSIAQNFERSVALARGDYVCVIGDDDGVTESIISLALWMKSTGIDAAVTPVSTYLWPGVSSALDGSQTQGVLRLPRYSARVDIATTSAALDAVLGSGGIRIQDLPSVYQGIVSRRALERLRAIAGTYFPGPSPDMANAVGLSAVVDRFARVSFPVVISGLSPASGAAQGARHDHQGEIADKTFLSRDTADRWPAQVPLYFSGPTLWATTLIHALSATGRGDLIGKLRWDRLYAACAVFNPKFRARVADARARNPGLVSMPRLAAAVCWVWGLRAKALVQNLARRDETSALSGGLVSSLADIEQVISYVTRTFGPIPFGR
jgi:glycosyltransferase involved in cell wall biosynthesis